MTNADYIRNFKLFGKLAKLYDDATADVATLETLQATTFDQIADGTTATLEAVGIFSGYYSRYSNGISSGAAALQSLAVSIGRAYIVTDEFVTGLTTQPASRSALLCVAALATEMSAGVDNKTLTTESSTGLVNFFDALAGAEQTWNTSGSPDYPDGTFVVSPVI